MFETPELIPSDVQAILDTFDDFTYQELDRIKDELQTVGYTFDYGLDAEPYNLRKL
jgi:hypothetical protein